MATGDRPMNGFNPVQDAAYIYAEDSNGSQVKIRKSDLTVLLKNELDIIERIKLPMDNVGNLWFRIMEFSNGSNAIFFLSLMSFGNTSQSFMIGHASTYDNTSYVDIKQFIGSIGGLFFVDVRYKYDGNKIIVWCKGGQHVNSYIYILRGGASAYPMVREDPPADANIPISY